MKTMFNRLFSMIAVLLLLCCFLMTVGFRFEFKRYLIREKEEALLSDANAIAALAGSFSSLDHLKYSWPFRVSMSFTSEVCTADCLICDADGHVILTSDDRLFVSDANILVPENVLREISTDSYYFGLGDLGTFTGAKYFLCVPITNSSQTLSGYIVVFADTTDIGEQLKQTTTIFILVSLIVLLIALLATYVFTTHETRPLKELSNAAHEFGHGNLKVRVKSSEGTAVEINNLAASFNSMADSLEQSEQKRREFVANVSHELKTPMTTISGFMDGMLDGTIPPAQHRKYMTTVSEEVRRLSRLVRSMLEISRLQDTGISETQKKRFDICETIGRTLLTFEQKIKSRSLNVDVQMPDNGLSVWAVEDSIIQVIFNLIDNAVKFADEGGSLFLEVGSDGQKATISVANTGETIPENELSLVFERFHKTDKSRSANTEGAGLGLYIVKTIVVTHGEDIYVTSRDGVTRFTFTLPVR